MPLAPYAQLGAAAPGRAAVPTTPLELVAAGSLATQAVLAVLLVLSLVSWGIALAKWLEFRRVTAAGRAFVREFEHARTIEEAEQLASRATPTPFTDVFRRAMVFLAETRPALAATADRGARLSGSQVEALRLVLDAETDMGRDRLGRFITWLATIGSVSPLIGLLGTGARRDLAFTGIAQKGSGNIAPSRRAWPRRSSRRRRRWPVAIPRCSRTTCSPTGSTGSTESSRGSARS
jgi:biopolymer transport protein TolQ